MRIPKVRDFLLDEAEGFLLEHALISPPRTWPPLPSTQTDRLTQNRRKMDWEGEVAANPDEPIELPTAGSEDGDANKERCVICLMALRDRTIVGVCGHEFCFECIGVWANQSRKCPLCSAEMAPFLLHDLDSITPTKFYLPPLPQLRLPSASQAGPSRHSQAQWRKQRAEMDELDYQVERRVEIYKNELFVKHIGSNPITKFVPNPTPRQISEDPILTQRATSFLRRELRVWSLVDVEVLTSHILNLIKAIDIRSEPAVRLLSEWLDTDEYPRGAEQFAHELYSWLRSPYKDLRRYDEIAQYDEVPEPRGRSISPSPARSLRKSPRPASPHSSPSRSRSRSISSSSSYSPRRARRSPSPPPRRWNEPDTWIDPEYEAFLASEKKRHEERMQQRRGRAERRDEGRDSKRMRVWGPPEQAGPVELLPSPPPAPLRMEEVRVDQAQANAQQAEASLLTIKGAARDGADIKRLTLLERLAKAKAERAAAPLPSPTPIEEEPPSITTKGRGLRARIQLKIKLESENKQFRHNLNTSKAQALRTRLLEAKAKREAEETDLGLKRLDIIDRKKEVRRRLMVLKMMAAETDQERRARELRDRLMARKRGNLGLGVTVAA